MSSLSEPTAQVSARDNEFLFIIFSLFIIFNCLWNISNYTAISISNGTAFQNQHRALMITGLWCLQKNKAEFIELQNYTENSKLILATYSCTAVQQSFLR